LAEIEARFGSFHGDDQRVRLYEKLKRYLSELFQLEHVEEVFLDGSFVSAKTNPDDVDLLIVFKSTFDLASPVTPAEYNVLDRRRIRRTYNFDAIPVISNTESCEAWINYFQQDTRRPGLLKGLLRLGPNDC
jgi:predicted nucleotidyltransferase